MPQTYPLDDGWKFKRADDDLLKPYERLLVAGDYCVGGPSFTLDESDWQNVSLPHDFVLEGNFKGTGAAVTDFPQDDPLLWSGSLPGGVGWYRKRFSLPRSDENQRIYLFFDGVFRDCRVYLNQCFVGGHRSGYTSFTFDVTDLVEFGGENLLALRVDASVPEGWFYEGGGIYRHVWLVKAPPVHISPWGVFASSQLDFSGEHPQAEIRVAVNALNKTPLPAHCMLITSFITPDQQLAAEMSSDITIPAWSSAEEIHTIALSAPKLWTLEQPDLYNIKTSLQAIDSADTDTITTPFGIRSARFDPERGFLLNEQPVKLKGVCCHQDHAGVGSALPDGLQEYRIRKLKEMGCNAYRSAHNPPSPALLDACDRLGMLVMDENRQFSSAPDDLVDLEALVLRDRNHPSIILWSIGNEEVGIQIKPQAGRIAQTLVEVVHKLDPTRPVTLATTFWDASVKPMVRMAIDGPTTNAQLDVMGFNYNEHLWQEYHRKYLSQPIVISEASTNYRTRGCYRSDDSQCFLSWDDPRSRGGAEKQWADVAQNDYLSGIFIWTGFDYRGEPLPQGWPGVSSNFGVMDLCGFPKDNYYYYKAWWSGEPIVHLFPHWNWPGEIGKPIEVGCYSNCEEVELLVNGQSLGTKKMLPNSHLEWSGVIYIPGAIEARGYRGGQLVANQIVETTGPAHAVRLLPDFVGGSPNRLAVINVSIVDEAGRLVPTADPLIHFQVEGPGWILGTGNGNPSSHEPDHAPYRRAFNGLCQVIVQIGEETGTVLLSGRAAGLISGQITI